MAPQSLFGSPSAKTIRNRLGELQSFLVEVAQRSFICRTQINDSAIVFCLPSGVDFVVSAPFAFVTLSFRGEPAATEAIECQQ